MSSDLTHGSFTVCDVSEGDVYRRTSPSRPALVGVDIAFPGTAGREFKVVGNQLTADTSLRIAVTGRIYKASRAAMESFLDALDAHRTSASTIIGTLAMTDGSYEDMRFEDFSHGGILTLDSGGAVIEFSAAFSHYTAVIS